MNNWEVKKISEVANTFSGGTPSRTNQDYFIGEIPWVKSGELNDKFIFSTTEHINPESIKNSSAKILPTNTLLVALYGETVGKTAILRIEAATNQAICAIISKDKSSFDSYYLQCQLIKNRSKLLAKRSGGAQPNISQEIIRNLEIPFPPLPEQKAIAEILSTVDEAIQKSDEAIIRTERLKREMMNKLLTQGIGHINFKETKIGNIPSEWDVKKVSEVFEIITGTTPSTKEEKYWKRGDRIWITPTDLSKMKKNIYIYDSERKITQDALNDTNLIELPINSLILSTRAPVGYVAIIKKEASFNQGCKALIGKGKNINSEFYYYYFLKIRKYLESISGGSTFKELSKDSLINLEIPVPSIDEQKEISNILLSIDKKLSLELERKQKFINIKKSLMNDLLTGKKRVQI